jgi:hypothetical protein
MLFQLFVVLVCQRCIANFRQKFKFLEYRITFYFNKFQVCSSHTIFSVFLKPSYGQEGIISSKK